VLIEMMHLKWKTISLEVLGLVAALMAVTSAGAAQGRVAVRTVDDPATGDRWVLERDREHPEGPGRLVRIEGGAKKSAAPEARATEAAVIHAGDRVLVEEKTAVAEAQLEGVALSAAASGGMLTVRLAVGGRLVRATAIASGHARLAVEARR
jgi:hypothetical protein